MAAGQQEVSEGHYDAAAKAFRAASDQTPNSIPRVLLEHLQVAESNDGSCSVVGLGRPRPVELSSSIRRPDIVHTAHGPLLAWADDHEIPGQYHVYVTLLDSSMRALSTPVDVTPEASSAQEPRLLAAGDQVVLLFSDSYGHRPGIYARLLTAAGRIAGPPVRVSDDRNATSWPTITRASNGNLWVAFAQDDDRDPASRLWLQTLGADLKPLQEPVLVAELAERHGLYRSHARRPAVAISGEALLMAYRVEQGRDRYLVRQRIALDNPALTKGLPPSQDPNGDRMLGDVKVVTEKQARADFPTIACDSTGCFIAWRDEPRGANAAYIDASSGTVIWRKRFAIANTQVAVGLDGAGNGLMAWCQGGKVRAAPVTRDGIREPSSIARVKGDQPLASVSVGRSRGQWLLAWTDYEAGHLEAYTARLLCK